MTEMLYHPEMYKAKFCKNSNKSKKDKAICGEYGEYCAHAHFDHELSVENLKDYKQDADFYMFHFKTVFCPL
jgi:hypothetical protein